MSRKIKTKSRRLKSRRSKSKHLRKTQRHNKNQKKYYMIGCNDDKCRCSCHHHGGSSPIGGLPIKGGSCFGPLVGSPYSADEGGNYYDLPKSEAYSVDRNMKLRGGTMLPSNLVNIGRQMSYGAQSVSNGLSGYKAPVDPAPYIQNKI